MYKDILNAKLKTGKRSHKTELPRRKGGEGPHLRRSLHVSLNSTMTGTKITV